MNIQEKLRAWADVAYDFYSKEAYTLDLDFYTQSDLREFNKQVQNYEMFL